MNLSEICVKRPVLSIVLSLILIVVGIMGFTFLKTRFLPKYEKNEITISTTYAGASAKLVESSVTTPLEKAISGVEGIDTIQSDSYQGMSVIDVKLNSGANLYQTTNEIRNKVSQNIDTLPSDADTPIVDTGHFGGGLLNVVFTSSQMSTQSILNYLDNGIVDHLEQIPGVSSVESTGADKYAMRIWLDPQKMAAYGLSVESVESAIANSNLELPAGQIKGMTIDYPITAATKLQTAEQFNNIIISNIDGHVVRVKNIGYAKIGNDSSDQSIVTVNGVPGVLLQVDASTDANQIAVAKAINAYLNQIAPTLPYGMKITHSFDLSVFMNQSVHEVYTTILISILCVILVIYLFLGHLRTVAIPIATIPVCLVATFGVMYFLGFTINIITLLAIVLSIGLVVDDAIVMLENIYRHIEMGEKPFIAAIRGSKEITFSVIAMTITLAAVYAPIGLIQNQAAQIFRSFAFTLAGAVLISGFVALTLSPMMAARVFKGGFKEATGYGLFIEKLYDRMANGYRKLLNSILNKRLIILCVTIVIGVGGFYFFGKNLPLAFIPHEDMGVVIAETKTSSGSSITDLANQQNKVSQFFEKNPNVATVVNLANTNPEAFNSTLVTLKPYYRRTQSSTQVANEINNQILQTPGLSATAFAPSFGGNMQHPLEFTITSSGGYKNLYYTAKTVMSKLRKYPGFSDLSTNLTFDSQQYTLHVNRELAGKLNVSIADIDRTVAGLLGGSKISTFNSEGQSYNVYVQAQPKDLHSLASINKFYVNTASNQLVPLSNLVKITPTQGQDDLTRFNRQHSVIIYGQLAAGYDLGTVIRYLQQTLPHIVPHNDKFDFLGMAQQILESNSSMSIIFGLAVIFIYLVLAAQFESFIDPFIILLGVPLSIVGAMACLKLIGGSLNIYTDIGLVTLIGLISKHGILITKFANNLGEQGLDMREALLKSASLRLRPILMTTAAMIFGAIPLLLSKGGSANSRHQIGIVIIGGLFFGTFFSLVVVPIVYSYAHKLKSLLSKHHHK